MYVYVYIAWRLHLLVLLVLLVLLLLAALRRASDAQEPQLIDHVLYT